MLTHEVEAFETALCMTASLTTASQLAEWRQKDRAIQCKVRCLDTCARRDRAGQICAHAHIFCFNYVTRNNYYVISYTCD